MPMMPPPEAMNAMPPEMMQGMQADMMPEEQEMPDPNQGAQPGGEAPGALLLAQLAVQFRVLQLSASMCRSLVSGPSSFSDRATIADFGRQYEAGHDSIVERLVGMGTSPRLAVIQRRAVAEVEDPPPDATSMFALLLQGEQAIQQLMEGMDGSGLSAGTEYMLSGLADASERRQYLLVQRTAAGQPAPEMPM